MRLARLDELCDVNPRSPQTLSDRDLVSFLPMAAVSENGHIDFEEERPFGEVKKGYTRFQRGDVLVAKITPCFENGKATRTNSLRHETGFGSTEFHVLRAGSEIDTSYLFHMIWNVKFREAGAKNMTGSAGQKRVPTDFLKRLEIPLPRLAEQRRIAAILDKADALRRKRKQAVSLMNSATPAMFEEMFGDERNSRFTIETLNEVTDKITDGTHFTPTYVDDGVPFLRVTDIQGDKIDWKDVKYIPKSEHDQLVARCRPEQGDVLLSKNGTIGIPRLIDWPEDFSIFVSLCLIKPKRKVLSARYLTTYLRTASAQAQLRQHSKTGTVTNLHLVEIRKLRIPIPPMAEQRKWEVAEETLANTAARLKSACVNAGDLFESLQHRAFSGQL